MTMTPSQVELAAACAVVTPLLKVTGHCERQCARLQRCVESLGYLIARGDFSEQQEMLLSVQYHTYQEWRKELDFWIWAQEQVKPGMAHLDALMAAQGIKVQP
jgi:hypothetical protein